MSDRPDLGELTAQLDGSAGVNLHLDGHAAFTLAAALQLATRHPGVDGPVRELVVDVVERIAAGMGGPVAEAIALGWDTSYDVEAER